MSKRKAAIILSHNGLGDNISMIGAINFILNYYEKVYFICKEHNKKNMENIFFNKPVVLKSFKDGREELSLCKNIIHKVSQLESELDIYVSGAYKGYIGCRINHNEVKNYVKNKKSKKIYSCKFLHIKRFYEDIGLDLSVYYEYFDINSTKRSKELYSIINNNKIVFMHTKSSNKTINPTSLINKYKNNEEYIIICANKNVYSSNNNKYELANQFINIPIVDYIDVIKNAEIIYVIDSCFSCIVYPLKNKLKASQIDIISR